MLYDLRNYTGQGKPNFSEWCEKMAEKLFADNGGNPGKLNIQQKQLLSSLNKNRFNIYRLDRIKWNNPSNNSYNYNWFNRK